MTNQYDYMNSLAPMLETLAEKLARMPDDKVPRVDRVRLTMYLRSLASAERLELKRMVSATKSLRDHRQRVSKTLEEIRNLTGGQNDVG